MCQSTKAIEMEKGTSSILVIVVSVLGGLIILAGILVNVLVFFCRGDFLRSRPNKKNDGKSKYHSNKSCDL